MFALEAVCLYNTLMNTYNIFCEFDNAKDSTVTVLTLADLDNCDSDMLASEIELCLQEQHSISEENGLISWSFVK